MPRYAVIADEETTPTQAPIPAAVFAEIEDAMDWGLNHFQGKAFRIKHLPLIALPAEASNTMS